MSQAVWHLRVALGVALLWPGASAAAVAGPTDAPCGFEALPGMQAQRARLQRDLRRATSTDAEAAPTAQALRAGALGDFGRVVAAVLDRPAQAVPSPADGWDGGVGGPAGGPGPCDAATKARDRVVWVMTLAGYSAREIADVVGGHLSRRDVDRARALLMTGQSPGLVSAFLDARWRARLDQEPPPAAPLPPKPMPNHLDVHLAALSRTYGLDPALVRAVVEAESGGDPRARSTAGAIGLMQLMPATAAALGVDPWDPLDNLRGGIAYLAGLLRAYGNAALALVAYNAGPQHADRVKAGQAVPYRETRRYLDAIRRRYPIPVI